jgi:hypothetical protein
MDHGNRLFDRNNREYNEDGIKFKPKTAPSRGKPITVPFKGMSSIQPTLNKFPNYIEDPGRE